MKLASVGTFLNSGTASFSTTCSPAGLNPRRDKPASSLKVSLNTVASYSDAELQKVQIFRETKGLIAVYR